ncbi:MAG: 2TM domain-containing protein [Chryseolinea sp.]
MNYQTNLTPQSFESLKKGFRIHLLSFVVGVPAIWLIWYLTSTTYPWPLWATPAWAIGVVFHYLGVFVFRRNKNI